uniref:Uncharacterized protein n=1 Tax=Arundo donax TaxID=35708 RepID=A0A0A8YJU3_ARUDO
MSIEGLSDAEHSRCHPLLPLSQIQERGNVIAATSRSNED